MFQLAPPHLRSLALVATLAIDVTGVIRSPGTASASASASTYRVPTSIASDCTGGQTAALNTWLASIPSGTANSPVTVDFGDSAACYLLDDIATSSGVEYNAVRINDKAYWTLAGTATFKRTTPVVGGQNRALLAITRGQHITLDSGMKFIGQRVKPNYDPNVEHDHNVVILGGSHISLSGFTATTASGDNLYVAPIGTSIPHAISVKNATLTDASRHNVAVIGTTGMTLDRSTLRNNGYWSIDAELSHGSWPMKDVVISNNTASGQQYGFLALSSRSDASAEGGPGIDTVTVTGNTVTTPGETTYEFVNINSSASSDAPTKNVTIANNTFTQHQFGISAKYVSNLRVTDNQGTTDGVGASAADCLGELALVAGGSGVDGVVIKDNNFRSTSLWRDTTVWCQKVGSSPSATNVSVPGNISIPGPLFPGGIFRLLAR